MRREQKVVNRITEVSNEITIAEAFLKYRKIYIYGTGRYGNTCAELLAENNINFDGYIMSKKDIDCIEDHPVYSYSELLCDLKDDDCLIFAMKKEYQYEVLKIIDNSYKGQLVNIIENDSFKKIYNKKYIELMEELALKYPPMKYSTNEFSNILVIRLDRMGDMIWTTAFFRELRKNYPNSHITVVCSKNNWQLLHNCPYVDKCLSYEYSYEEEIGLLPNEEVLKRAKEYAKKELNNIVYDVVFLPRGIMPMDRMANIYLAVFSSARIRIAGYYETIDNVEAWYREVMSKLFSTISSHKYPLHDVEKALNVLKSIGCTIEDDTTEIWYEKKHTIADMTLEELGLLRKKFKYLIAIGLTAQDPIKTWDPQNYKKLFARIAREFSVCFLLLGNMEAKKEASIVFDNRYCLDYTGKTDINDAIYLISMSDIYVGSDTGLKHVAAALKKPVIEISASFPWSDDNGGLSPHHCGAWRTKYVVITPTKPKSEDCARTGYCAKKYSHCINNVSVYSVWNVLTGFLKYYRFSK